MKQTAESNKNININKSTINIGYSKPKRSGPNWLTKLVVGGIISIAVAMCIYYLQKPTDSKKNRDAASSPIENQVESKK